MPNVYEGKLNGEGFRFGIVVSRFNEFITSHLLAGALDALVRNGAADKDVDVFKVPGSFEIPFAARRLALQNRYDAIICLGAVIRGDTPHYEYIAAEVTKGIAATALETQVPISFGVLTTDTLEQAIQRAGSKEGNKGWDAAVTALEMVNLQKSLGKKT